MLYANNPHVEVTLFGESNVLSLLYKTCGGYWMLANRKEELEEFKRAVPLRTVSVQFHDKVFNVMTDGTFYGPEFDKATDALKTVPGLKLSSDMVNVCLVDSSLVVRIY